MLVKWDFICQSVRHCQGMTRSNHRIRARSYMCSMIRVAMGHFGCPPPPWGNEFNSRHSGSIHLVASLAYWIKSIHEEQGLNLTFT